ncbi:MAG: hypothetical protein ACLQVY_19630, partial [Limisphaerales bacterium]
RKSELCDPYPVNPVHPVKKAFLVAARRAAALRLRAFALNSIARLRLRGDIGSDGVREGDREVAG